MSKQDKQVKLLDNRIFGLVFSAIFFVIAFLPFIWGGEYRFWALLVALVWAVPALFFPSVLAPLNRLWAQFGLLMHKVVNPVLMALIFFLTVVPTGLVLKLFGKDPMRRKFDSNVDSYWISRDPQSLTKESFDDQF